MNLREKTKEFIENMGKKSFMIYMEEGYSLPTKDGYIPPKTEDMQAAIEKYCIKNKHELTYIRLSDPIIFMLDGKEVYEARPLLMRSGFVPEYVVKCMEFK